jgi:hypothetical protein
MSKILANDSARGTEANGMGKLQRDIGSWMSGALFGCQEGPVSAFYYTTKIKASYYTQTALHYRFSDQSSETKVWGQSVF